MKCERCGQRPSIIHQTLVMNGEKQEIHLCEACARETGALGSATSPGDFAFPNLSIQQLLSSFLGQSPGSGPAVNARRRAEPICQHCGMTYGQFADSGRLGCAHCYDDLGPHLEPLIKRIHGTTAHAGKAPKRTGGIVRKRMEMEAVRQQLFKAVQEEHYEEAARLRDLLKRLEGQIQAGSDGNDVE